MIEAREALHMFTKRGRSARAHCTHSETVTIRHAGIERTVCEGCGHVSLRALESLSGRLDRNRFERRVERTH